VLVPLALIAVLSPLIANDRPLMARYEGRVVFPAFGQLPLLGGLFDRPEFSRIDWATRTGESGLVRAPVPHHFAETDLEHRYAPPGREHLLGTDGLGRDVLARLIRGTRISMSVGILATGLALAIALVVGSLAGFYGGWTDSLLSRMIEVVNPPVLRGFSDLTRIMLVIGLTGWTGMARYLRAEFLRLKSIDFVTAARGSGASDLRIILRHILPNALAPVLVSASFFVAQAVLIEAAISFLGFGIQPPEPSWGSMLTEAQEAVSVAWWLALFPGGALFLAVLGYNLLGEGLRAALDPRGPGPGPAR
jgi:peptide/nickel transport system permease protein